MVTKARATIQVQVLRRSRFAIAGSIAQVRAGAGLAGAGLAGRRLNHSAKVPSMPGGWLRKRRVATRANACTVSQTLARLRLRPRPDSCERTTATIQNLRHR